MLQSNMHSFIKKTLVYEHNKIKYIYFSLSVVTELEKFLLGLHFVNNKSILTH